jgi:nucleolar GTP-binding protein
MVGDERMQIIDTPGLLDRPPEDRNPIERQALTAMINLADVVLYIIDASEHCGYPIEEQIRLLHVVETLVEVPLVVVVNKADLVYFDGYLNMSTENGEGVDEVLETLLHYQSRSDEERNPVPC